VQRRFIAMVSMELKLYSREWCSWCIDAKDYLSERGYKFTEIDVGQDRQAYEEMKEISEQTYVPTLVLDDGDDDAKVLANFDTDQLEEFLRAHHASP
jgi:glutaredoxin